jgi:hypothetical protein
VKRIASAGLAAALVLALAGCANTGPKIEAAQLSDLREGKTTVAEVIKRFGRPSVLSKNMDGTQTAAYMWAEDRSSAAALVPLVSALAGKADADVDAVVFRFDTNGVLTGFSTTQAGGDEPLTAPAQAAAQPSQAALPGLPGAMSPSQAVSAAQKQPDAVQPPKKAAARKAWTFQPLRQVENPR